MPTYNSWIHTRVQWDHIIWSDGTGGRAAIFPCSQARMPWLKVPPRKLMVTLSKQELGIYKYDDIPESQISRTDKIVLSTRVLYLRQLAEFFDWPNVESIVNGYSGDLLEDTLPALGLTHTLMDEWKQRPFVTEPGWWVINRGPLGVSFLRDMSDGNCVEVRTAKAIVYAGPLAENDALLDSKIIKAWQLHEFNNSRDYMSSNDHMMCRALIRNIRYRIWLYACEQDMPF